MGCRIPAMRTVVNAICFIRPSSRNLTSHDGYYCYMRDLINCGPNAVVDILAVCDSSLA